MIIVSSYASFLSSCHSQLLHCTITGQWAPNSAHPNRLHKELDNQYSRGVSHSLYKCYHFKVYCKRALLICCSSLDEVYFSFQMHYILQLHWVCLCGLARGHSMSLHEWTSLDKSNCWQVQHGLLRRWKLFMWRWMDNRCPSEPSLPLIQLDIYRMFQE